MAAPTVSVRVTPSDALLVEGYQTLISFANVPNVNFYEKQVMPPGLDGGDAINITTMFNIKWHTFSPRKLFEVSPSETTVAYNPDVYNKIIKYLLLVNQSVTWHFPDGSSVAAYAFLQKFVPAELKEKEFPEAKVSIWITNYDPVNKVEAGPVIVQATGT